MTKVLDRIDTFVRQIERLDAGTAATAPPLLREIRRHGARRFTDAGLPTVELEEWRFTNPAPVIAAGYEPATGLEGGPSEADLAPHRIAGTAGALVFVNGRFAPALSRLDGLPAGAVAGDLASLAASQPALLEPWLDRIAVADHPFAALNSALVTDGAIVCMPAHAIADRPIHLLFWSTAPAGPLASHPRTLVVLGENSQATVVETYAGPDGQRYLTNAVTEVALAANAVADHYKIQREGSAAAHVAVMRTWAARSAAFSSHAITLGGSFVRNDIVGVLDGEGADCTLNGLYLAQPGALVDNHTTIDHARPHCDSHELYKGILAGRARGVFNGKIIVRPDAQKTDAKQTNKALLLSDDAQVNTKPQLEIFANDVKCTHGAAIGQLDDDAVFYLRARGLDRAEARRVLIHAFAGEVLDRMRAGAIRAAVEPLLPRYLPAL